MSAFVFRLDRLLKLREQEEAAKARELSAALRREEEARRAVAEAEAHIERCSNHIHANGGAGGTTPAGLLRHLGAVMQSAARGLLSAERAHVATTENVARGQAEYGEARKERRVLERLSERAGAEWKRDLDRLEQKETDALAGSRWKAREEK